MLPILGRIICPNIRFQTCPHANYFLLYIKITEQQKKFEKNYSKRYLRGSEVCLVRPQKLEFWHFKIWLESEIICVYVIKHDQTSTEMYFFLKFVEGILYYKQFKKFKMAAILSIWPKTENLNYEHISVTHVYNHFWGWETHWSHYFYSMMVPCDCNSIFHLPAFVLVSKMVMTEILFLMGSIFNSSQWATCFVWGLKYLGFRITRLHLF